MSSSLNNLPVPWWSVITDDGDTEAIGKVLKSNFPNEGPVTLDLEEFFKEFFNVKYAILTTSGTIALYLGLKALGIGPGDRVAVPDLTFIATANAVSLTGATPVLIDVIESTLCIDPEYLQKEHSISPLKAVIPVHISGRSAFTEDLINVIRRLNLICIEDAAEAFGSRDPRTGKLLGTIGAVGAFSFSPNKIITSGQGGLVVTDDDELRMATELVERKARAMIRLDPQVRKRRLFGLLARKGYGTAIALKVLSDLDADDFDGAEIVSDLT